MEGVNVFHLPGQCHTGPAGAVDRCARRIGHAQAAIIGQLKFNEPVFSQKHREFDPVAIERDRGCPSVAVKNRVGAMNFHRAIFVPNRFMQKWSAPAYANRADGVNWHRTPTLVDKRQLRHVSHDIEQSLAWHLITERRRHRNFLFHCRARTINLTPYGIDLPFSVKHVTFR